MIDLPSIVSTPNGPMVVGSSPELLKRLLVGVDRALREIGLDLDGWFRPGLSRETIAGQLRAIGLESPELSVWFSWHNGYRPSPLPSGEPPIPNFVMGTLEDAVARYRQSRSFVPPAQMQESLGAIDFDFGAGEGWLRLASDSEGLAIYAKDSISPQIRYANGDFEYAPETMYRAVSLCTYATWWLFGLRNGGYTWDVDASSWTMDIERLAPSQVEARFW